MKMRMRRMNPEDSEWFKPEKLKKVLVTGSLLGLSIFMVPLLISGFFVGGSYAMVVYGVSAVFIVLLLWYISAFYRTVYYRIGEDDVEYRGGVFFKKQTSVPYERITHVDTGQGPILRFFDAGSVKIQTAGQSAQAGAELVIKSVTDFEDVKERIRQKANRSSAGKKPEGEKVSEDDLAVEELRSIRELLEERL